MSLTDFVPGLNAGLSVAQKVVELPFSTNLLRPPPLRVRLPSIPRPSAMAVFCVLYLSYFLVSSGFIYDLIVEPPSIGSKQDPVTGAIKPEAFLPYRINGQYIMEGLASGFLFSLGGLGFIFLDWSNNKHTTPTNRYLLVLSGILCCMVSYNLCLVFIRMKVPGYMQSD